MSVEKIGKKIKLARVEKDLTQTQLGKKLRITQKTISLYETGKVRLSVITFLKIAKVLKKHSSYFLENSI